MIPHPSLLVLGTDTGVGKTAVTALIGRCYQRAGADVAAYKPIVSGALATDGTLRWADTSFLAAAVGSTEAAAGTYRLQAPLSPHLASAAEGAAIDLATIAAHVRELRQMHDAVLVEGVGGVMVPLTAETTFLDLAARLDLPAVVVARPGLGTLNHTQLTVSALRNAGVHVAGIVVCGMPAAPTPAEATAPDELARLTRVPLLGVVPAIPDLDVESGDPAPLDAHLDCLDLSCAHLPGADYARALTSDHEHVWHPFTPMQEYLAEQPRPLMIVKAHGSTLTDADGRDFIDGVSSLWVTVHGHRTPRIDAAVREQLGKVAHTTLLGLANEPSALLAERLVGVAPPGLNRVFYSDSGSTAVEVGLKIAFQYWKQTGRPGKREFIALDEAYHGDTIGSVSVGGMPLFHRIFEPLLFEVDRIPTPYCYRCPLGASLPECGMGCLEPLETLLAERADSIAALVVEPRVQGAAGMLLQPPGWLARVAGLCRAHDVLLIADEVATGFGRTGRMFACEHEAIEPDIMAVAKGITGGYLPLAATLVRESIYEAFLGKPEEQRTFFHGHTYTGNPLACAAALANLDLFDDLDVLSQVRDRASRLADALESLAALPHVGQIRQLGLMVGIELVRDAATREAFDSEIRVGRAVILDARSRGAIIRPLGDTIVLMPPLGITQSELDRLVAITAESIASVTSALA